MECRKWTMRDGQKIWIKDMSDSHLVNTLKLLHRHAWALSEQNAWEAFRALQSLRGEQAIYSMEKELDRWWTDFLPAIYDSLLGYARKREFWDELLEKRFNIDESLYFRDSSPYWVYDRKEKT